MSRRYYVLNFGPLDYSCVTSLTYMCHIIQLPGMQPFLQQADLQWIAYIIGKKLLSADIDISKNISATTLICQKYIQKVHFYIHIFKSTFFLYTEIT